MAKEEQTRKIKGPSVLSLIACPTFRKDLADSSLTSTKRQLSILNRPDFGAPLLHSPSTKQNPFTMKTTLLSASVALAAWTTSTIAHNIQMGAHSRECFHEQLHKDDKMTVTFQVGDREFGGAGNLEIDFWVRTLPPSRCTPRFAEPCEEQIGVEPPAVI